MDAQAWVALATLAFIVLCEGFAVAFLMGGLFTRVKTLETRPDAGDCKAELAALKATVSEFKEAILQRFESMERALSAPARPRVVK